MPWTEILRIPNLLSLSRIALAPIIGYYLWRGDTTATHIAIALLVVAGITDGLDGYLARRWNQVGRLGIALDPIADKLMAAILVICLVLFRDMPLWLAGVIVGRDLLIIICGSLLLAGHRLTTPSNLTGKYAFGAIVLLLASYVLRFDFGIQLITYVTLVLITASMFTYGRIFVSLRQGRPAPIFHDKSAYRIIRTGLTVILSAIYLVRLYSDLIR